MSENIFRCCNNTPEFLITYSVAGEPKIYSVCKSCESLTYFKKFVIRKVSLYSSTADAAKDHVATISGGGK